LYFAWESIVRCENGAAQVNLLLNRASPWLDLESHLPYEGKVVAKIKTAEKLALRIPRWAEKRSVRAKVNGQEVALEWLGRYLVFRDLRPNDVVTVQFPMVEATESYTLKWKRSDLWFESNYPGQSWQPAASPVKFRCRFRGNTLVDISPRAEGPGYALYQRAQYESETAPRRSVTRFVPNSIYPW
jgi:hypothetical protein